MGNSRSKAFRLGCASHQQTDAVEPQHSPERAPSRRLDISCKGDVPKAQNDEVALDPLEQSPPQGARRTYRSPWHSLRCAFGKKLEVTIKLGSEIVCTRHFSPDADCLDLTVAAYKHDTKGLLTTRDRLDPAGGIAAFQLEGAGSTLKPGGKLMSISNFANSNQFTLVIISHADLVRKTIRHIVSRERQKSISAAFFKQMPAACKRNLRRYIEYMNQVRKSAVRQPEAADLKPYDYDEEQSMDVATAWNTHGHCKAYFRPSSEDLKVVPLSERPGNVERGWICVHVIGTKSYPLVMASHCVDLPSSIKYRTTHPSLSFKAVEDATVKATMGQYDLFQRNCQTSLLDLYRGINLAEFAAQHDNMLARKGAQTTEHNERLGTHHYSLDRFPDKGVLVFCRPEACIACCGAG